VPDVAPRRCEWYPASILFKVEKWKALLTVSAFNKN